MNGHWPHKHRVGHSMQVAGLLLGPGLSAIDVALVVTTAMLCSARCPRTTPGSGTVNPSVSLDRSQCNALRQLLP